MASWSVLKTAPGLTVHIAATDEGLCRIALNVTEEEFVAGLRREFPLIEWRRDDQHPILAEARRQLAGYFDGTLIEFDLPLASGGTAFQQQVWRALRRIPYGETRSYREVAESIGSPKATRAVGAANGRNPLPIVVPCHRVVAADGSLGGFSAGLPVKRLLLAHERRTAHSMELSAASG